MLSVATVALVAVAGRTTVVTATQTPAAAGLQSIGPLTFGPDGVLFAADRQAATIYAIDLGAQATSGAPGAKDVAGLDQQIAAMLGTDAKQIQITDLAGHPKSHNAFIAVMRGTGADAKPAPALLVRSSDSVRTANPMAVSFRIGSSLRRRSLRRALSQDSNNDVNSVSNRGDGGIEGSWRHVG